jgi:hypothetical protein
MTRLYLTWFAGPEDPRYWEYFSVEGLVVSLKSIINMRKHRGFGLINRLLSEGFRKFYGYNGPLIIDSMIQALHVRASSVSDLNQSLILYLQYVLGSDVLVHRDYPLINVEDPELRGKLFMRNLVNAEAALRFGESIGRDVMLVVQGWDLESYTKCAQYYKDLGARYVGVGSLVPHRNDWNFITNIVKSIREALGKGVHIHLFGIGSPSLLRRVSNLVDSVDISTPAIAAGKKEVFILGNDGIVRVKVSSVDGVSMLKLRLEITNDEVERRLIEMILNARSLRDENRAVMLYNAYILNKYKSSLIGGT